MIFRCGACGKDFSVRTGTFLGDTKISYQNWLIAIYFVTSHKKCIASSQLATNLGVTQKTAWFMIQRILHVASTESHNMLSGVVELGETYVGGVEGNKHKSKRTTNPNIIQGDKTMILGMLERGGDLVMKKFDKINKVNVQPIIDQHISETAIVNTDESTIYKGALSGRERRIVNHKKKQYVNGEDTTNRIEGSFAHFKRMVSGIHHWLSHKHIQKYTNMFCFRWNTRGFDEHSRIDIFLSDTINSRIMYKEVIA
jgi:hypothetical protein